MTWILLLRGINVGAKNRLPMRELRLYLQTLHLFFLASVPVAPEIALLSEVKVPSERFHLTDEVFYLHAPEGIGRSKLAARVGKTLGVELTARNWRTVQTLWEMAGVR